MNFHSNTGSKGHPHYPGHLAKALSMAFTEMFPGARNDQSGSWQRLEFKHCCKKKERNLEGTKVTTAPEAPNCHDVTAATGVRSCAGPSGAAAPGSLGRAMAPRGCVAGGWGRGP